MKRLSGVLLDIDGTLVKSNDFHAHAWEDALEMHGYQVTFSELRNLMGMGADKIIPMLTGLKISSKKAQKIIKDRWDIFVAKYLPSLVAYPKARDLILMIKAKGLKPVLVSSSNKQEMRTILKQAHLDDLIDVAGHAARSKPDPDILSAALEESHLATDEVVMIGDTPYDIMAASSLKIPTIAFTSGGWSPNALSGAMKVYDSPAELVEKMDESPLRAGA